MIMTTREESLATGAGEGTSCLPMKTMDLIKVRSGRMPEQQRADSMTQRIGHRWRLII
jgi:hypothetical protein